MNDDDDGEMQNANGGASKQATERSIIPPTPSKRTEKMIPPKAQCLSSSPEPRSRSLVKSQKLPNRDHLSRNKGGVTLPHFNPIIPKAFPVYDFW
jgi:hypothetical protein